MAVSKPIQTQEHIAAKNVTRGAEQIARTVGRARVRRALDRSSEVTISNRDNPIDSIFHTNHALSSPDNVYVRRGDNLWIMKTRNWNSVLKELEAAAPATPALDPMSPSTSKTEGTEASGKTRDECRPNCRSWGGDACSCGFHASEVRKKRGPQSEEWEKPWLKKEKDEDGDEDGGKDDDGGGPPKAKKKASSGSSSPFFKGGDFFKMEGLEHLLPYKPSLNESTGAKSRRVYLKEDSDSLAAPESPGSKRIGKAERKYIQFGVAGPGSYTPTGATVEGLQPGLYRLSQDYNGNIYFNEAQLDSDSLLRFEDARYANVISQVSRFWGMKEKYENMGMIHKRGLLLYGPPGTGKSCLLKLVMEDSIAQGNIVVIAEDVSAVASAMGPLRQVEPDRQVLVILEDVDEMREHSLLQVFDGDNTASNILYLGTTNYVERLAPRVLRPGRFDLKVEVGPPPETGRRAFFKGKTSRLGLTDEAIEAYVAATDKFSFGQLREFLVCVHCYDETPAEAAKKLANGGYITESVTDAALTLLLA